jgi:glycosyltransferase involved in cell wall biosynthesis
VTPRDPALSVLVRVKNEGSALREFWDRLSSQTIFHKVEVVFLDSGSVDGSLEFIKQLPVSLYQIAPEDFHFGSSCNLLMSLSHAPVVAFLSGHVLLEQIDALQKLHDALVAHEYTAAFLRQVPNTVWGATIYEKAYLARSFPDGNAESLKVPSPNGFSNAASGLTRAAWQRIPFPEINASEDRMWAKQHLGLGGILLYLPSVSVMHSHNESADQTFARVLLNVRASGSKGSYVRSGYYCAGVFVSMLLKGASPVEAWRYASAHGRAYLPIRRKGNPHDASSPRQER